MDECWCMGSISCPSVDLLKSSRHLVDEESNANLLLLSSTIVLLGTKSLPADWAGGVPVHKLDDSVSNVKMLKVSRLK